MVRLDLKHVADKLKFTRSVQIYSGMMYGIVLGRTLRRKVV
jgi:hypothetical protein